MSHFDPRTTTTVVGEGRATTSNDSPPRIRLVRLLVPGPMDDFLAAGGQLPLHGPASHSSSVAAHMRGLAVASRRRPPIFLPAATARPAATHGGGVDVQTEEWTSTTTVDDYFLWPPKELRRQFSLPGWGPADACMTDTDDEVEATTKKDHGSTSANGGEATADDALVHHDISDTVPRWLPLLAADPTADQTYRAAHGSTSSRPRDARAARRALRWVQRARRLVRQVRELDQHCFPVSYETSFYEWLQSSERAVSIAAFVDPVAAELRKRRPPPRRPKRTTQRSPAEANPTTAVDAGPTSSAASPFFPCRPRHFSMLPETHPYVEESSPRPSNFHDARLSLHASLSLRPSRVTRFVDSDDEDNIVVPNCSAEGNAHRRRGDASDDSSDGDPDADSDDEGLLVGFIVCKAKALREDRELGPPTGGPIGDLFGWRQKLRLPASCGSLRDGYVATIGVREEFRGGGTASRLMNAAARVMRSRRSDDGRARGNDAAAHSALQRLEHGFHPGCATMWLHCLASNATALRFYRSRHGYVDAGERPGYYLIDGEVYSARVLYQLDAANEDVSGATGSIGGNVVTSRAALPAGRRRAESRRWWSSMAASLLSLWPWGRPTASHDPPTDPRTAMPPDS